MKLIQIIGELSSFDADDTESTIYTAEPWTADCEAIVAPASESKMNERLQMKYFLEVFIARDLLDDWTASCKNSPTLEEKCAILIYYGPGQYPRSG